MALSVARHDWSSGRSVSSATISAAGSAFASRRERRVTGLVDNAGWERNAAAQHCDRWEPVFETGDPVEKRRSETERLRRRY